MPINLCKVCQGKFYVKPSHTKLGWGKYCSIQCRNKAQLSGRSLLCNVCGKSIYRSLSKIKHSASGNFFCTKKCQTLWRNRFYIEEKSTNWKTGINVYRKILERAGYKKQCRICKIKDQKVLVVHHIDHTRNNNDISNLVWLCYNCHFLIHHDRVFSKKFTKSLTY